MASPTTHFSKRLTCTQADQEAHVLYIQVSRKDFSIVFRKIIENTQIEDITDSSSIGCIDTWALSIAGE